MTLEKILGAAAVFLIASSIAVKKTSDIRPNHVRNDNALVQLVDVVSDSFTADVALAGNDPNPKLMYGEAISKFSNPSTQEDAVEIMESLVGAYPANKEFMTTLASFYVKNDFIRPPIDFFTTFADANADLLGKNQAINKIVAKCLYDVAVNNMYHSIPDFYKPNRHPTFSDYEPVVEALELAASRQPAKIPKGDESFWANVHYELGWGYRRFSTLGPLEESPAWSKKSVEEHITSVKIGGKKFVQSKRERLPWGFTEAKGSIPLYELIVKIDPNPIWRDALETKKMMEDYGK